MLKIVFAASYSKDMKKRIQKNIIYLICFKESLQTDSDKRY